MQQAFSLFSDAAQNSSNEFTKSSDARNKNKLPSSNHVSRPASVPRTTQVSHHEKLQTLEQRVENDFHLGAAIQEIRENYPDKFDDIIKNTSIEVVRSSKIEDVSKILSKSLPDLGSISFGISKNQEKSLFMKKTKQAHIKLQKKCSMYKEATENLLSNGSIMIILNQSCVTASCVQDNDGHSIIYLNENTNSKEEKNKNKPTPIPADSLLFEITNLHVSASRFRSIKDKAVEGYYENPSRISVDLDPVLSNARINRVLNGASTIRPDALYATELEIQEQETEKAFKEAKKSIDVPPPMLKALFGIMKFLDRRGPVPINGVSSALSECRAALQAKDYGLVLFKARQALSEAMESAEKSAPTSLRARARLKPMKFLGRYVKLRLVNGSWSALDEMRIMSKEMTSAQGRAVQVLSGHTGDYMNQYHYLRQDRMPSKVERDLRERDLDHPSLSSTIEQVKNAREHMASLLGGRELDPDEVEAGIQLLLRCAYNRNFATYKQILLDIENKADDPALLDDAERSVIKFALDASANHPQNLAASRETLSRMFGADALPPA